MSAARELVTAASGFAEANVKFEDIKKALTSQDLLHASHGELERFLGSEGRELLRLLLQGHLDARGEARAVGPVVGDDGVERAQVRPNTTRELTTTVGTVKVTRTRYEARGVDGRHPTDAELELPPGRYSQDLTRLLAQQAAQVSFEKAIDFVAQTTGVAVPKRQAEELVRNAAQDFEAFYAGRQNGAPPSDKAFLLDGVEVLAGTNANPGGSSYAIWVKDSTNALEIVRVTAIGGNGGAGRDGTNGAKGNDGETGNPGTSPQDYECLCQDFNNLVGGNPGGNNCPSGPSGAGGRGAHVVENRNCDTAVRTGNPGQPSPGGAPGGQPETKGADGGNGSPGNDGAGGTANGQVNSSGFWSGVDGGTAGAGTNGVGGGGGGSGKTKRSNHVRCGFTNTYWWGGAGGGGGSAGCGGSPGTPGRAGGGSFGVFIYNASPLLRDSAFGHKSGGNGGRGGEGGAGGIGRDGGAGGTGYSGAQTGTNGGKGGKGGNGGRGGHGGGGAGGVAYGLYLSGTANPTCTNVSYDPAGSGGTGGIGGPSSGNRGADGAFGDRNRGSASCP